ncbi:shikimate dehydrogenase, partial [Streptococcus suis]
MPHKEKSMKFLDAFDVTAQRIGAVNTVTLVHGIFHCTNTDAYGFINNLKSSQEWTESALKKVVILGAGGAARA